jgi:formylglycine-generating enzyme required for sulfatase activity
MTKFDTVTDASVGTAIVGSYRPNSWGLYDMLGNVREFVIDRFTSGETLVNLRGMVYDPGKGNVVGRGNHYENPWTQNNRPASRHSGGLGVRSYLSGFRLACRAGLK